MGTQLPESRSGAKARQAFLFLKKTKKPLFCGGTLWTFAIAGPKLLLFSTSMLAFLVDFQRHDLGLLVLHSLTSDGEDVCNTADNQGWAIVIFKQLNSLTVAVGNQFIIGS